MSTNRSAPEHFFTVLLTVRHYLTHGRIAGLVAGSAALLAAICVLNPTSDSAPTTDDRPGIPVSVVLAEPVSSFAQTRHYTGLLVPRRSAEVSFERAARVISVLVDEGDSVNAGQELARLDVRRLETRRQMLQAQRDAAAALLAELESGPRAETIAATRATVRELRARLELSRLTHERTEKLQVRQSASGQEVDNTRLSLEAAGARLIQAEHRLQELETGTREEKITAQRAVVNQLDAQLADLQLDREDSILVAPFDGQISMRHIDEGTMASPGQPVVTIIENATIEARIGLPLDTVQELTVGDSVSIRLNDELCRATFARVLPQVDLQTRTRMAVFELSRDDSLKVTAGQTVRVTLSEAVDANGYWLPTAALSPGQRGLWSAYVVVSDNGAERIESRPVEILHTEGDRVLVTGTIHRDDRVVSGGVQRIVPGQKVQVTNQKPS